MSGLIAFIKEFHVVLSMIVAGIFVLIRWIKIGKQMTVGSCIHQASTGFILPSFAILLFSNIEPNLVKELSPHELGTAGMLAMIISIRELFIDGH